MPESAPVRLTECAAHDLSHLYQRKLFHGGEDNARAELSKLLLTIGSLGPRDGAPLPELEGLGHDEWRQRLSEGIRIVFATRDGGVDVALIEEERRGFPGLLLRRLLAL